MSLHKRIFMGNQFIQGRDEAGELVIKKKGDTVEVTDEQLVSFKDVLRTPESVAAEAEAAAKVTEIENPDPDDDDDED